MEDATMDDATLLPQNGFSYEEDNFADADLDDLFGPDNNDDGHTDNQIMSELTRRMQGDGGDTQDPASAQEINEDGHDEADHELDDLLMSATMPTQDGQAFDLNQLNERELDTTGEKADDAVDYGSITSDDLPDEEPAILGGPVRGSGHGHGQLLDGILDDADDDDSHLFGDDTEHVNQGPSATQREHKSDSGFQNADDPLTPISDAPGIGTLAALGARDEDMTEEEARQYRIQQLLFAGEGQAEAHGIQNMDSWLQIEFPLYDPDQGAPFWNSLLPAKPGKWPSKQSEAKIFKKPRPVRPTKVTFEIESDQKLLFTLPSASAASSRPRPDLIHVTESELDQLEALSESGSEDDLPNGITMRDINCMCTDFDTLSHNSLDDILLRDQQDFSVFNTQVDQNELDFGTFEHPVKKRRTGPSANDIVTLHRFDLPSFDNPDKMTARLAREVVLDLNDQRLLVEEIDQDLTRQRNQTGRDGGHVKSIKERLAQRFRTSNDAAYNLLQKNQKKIRGQLSNMTIDHSLPAIKLQWPYYQVKPPPNQLRNWHRKPLHFKSGFAFNKINRQRRKEIKTKPIRESFSKTRDLSIADNSYSLLMEYSEEHPTMLSQTGMGNKIINYYRKLDDNDSSRPKTDIGDTSVLLPTDKSPFQGFGHVDPGESVLTLYNSMYRAPLFRQGQNPAQSTDFLIVRETTGLNGQMHYLRNIDHQYVVGQELPSVLVPGTHSRMVTTASKNRLKAIAFRLARRKKAHRIRVEEVTKHFPDTNDMQNRQKMKEFMTYNKDHKEWEMRDNAPIPDEEEIQRSLRPEDVALLESMQVGAQYLHDSGFAEDENDDDDGDKDDKADMAIEQQLAPWKTTKNFIQAVNGKAMLELYGAGDPSGRQEAISFIKTSMKGGFRAQGMSTNENVTKAKNDAAPGGHTYNVAQQQRMYENSIREIWNRQKNVLSSQIEPDNIDDEGIDGQLDLVERNNRSRATPASGMQTPGTKRRDDETRSTHSRRSIGSQQPKYLRIRRSVWNEREQTMEVREVIESDPHVIKLYMKRKDQRDLTTANLQDLAPTGDAEVDARHRKRLEDELRRIESIKQKKPRKKKNAAIDAGSPSAMVGSPGPDGEPQTPAPSGGKITTATQRKCANCGQVGHIKTNKKLCPLLNGEWKENTTGQLDDAAFLGAPPTLN